MAGSEGEVKLLELETTVLGSDALKEKDGGRVSTAENLNKEKIYIYFHAFANIVFINIPKKSQPSTSH